MAQEIADSVFGKLCQAAFEEVVALYKVGDKLELAKRELTRIQCFLKEADDRIDRDARVKNWVEEMRGVSVLIQEAMDMYQAEVAEPSFLRKITGKHLAAKRKLGIKIDTILERIEEITRSKEKYGIENLGKRRVTESAVRVGPDRYVIPDLDELEIVGFVADKAKITAQLLDEKFPRRCVVSIVGTGGLGKTTLALKVYSSDAIKSGFNHRVWLSISQEFKHIDLLKKMLRTLRSIDKKEETLGEEYFIGEINQSLRNRKYLIVMDDVWSDRLWHQIKAALPDAGNGSRVLMTSRFANVAKAIDHTFEPYELPFLSKEESLQLFLKTALPNRACPTNLLDIAEQLANKCDRLPLALVLLGGLLSTKTQTRTVWGKLLKTMVWGVHGMECMNIVSTTYDDMPKPLKTCFQYLSCYPEDFQINAKSLIRQWVAEEFIPQQSGSTLEDTAEDYLEQLAERHMVIVVRRYYDDSIHTIRVHDVLRDLAIDKAKEDNFITVISTKDLNGSSSTLLPRLSLQSPDVEKLMEHAGPSLRSLHCYICPEELPDCSRYEKLKVCNIETGVLEYNVLRLERSNHLRYLRVHGHFQLILPVGQLRNIQTLDLGFHMIWGRQLSEFIWGIETLRHVLIKYPNRICGPPSGAKLRNLQTLGFVKYSNSWETQLPHLINVRCLMLVNRNLTSTKTTASLIQTLDNLISLTLTLQNHAILNDYKQMKFRSNKIAVVGEESASDVEKDESDSATDEEIDESDSATDEEKDGSGSEIEGNTGGMEFDNEFRDFIFNETNEIVNMQVFPFYNDLQKLHLHGMWVDCLDRPGVILPLNLVILSLNLNWLLKDPMPVLEKLQCLKKLRLGKHCYMGKKMICSAGGFPCLEKLKISELDNLVELKIDEGAMGTLKLLTIEHCYKLKRLEIEEGAMPSLKLLHMNWCGFVNSLPMHLTCRIEQIDFFAHDESDADEESLPVQPSS